MAELGITVGCDTTHYCPDGTLTYGQASVFMVRARQVREATGATSVPPLDCTGTVPNAIRPASCSPYFYDVPTSHPYFPYIQRAKEIMGNQVIGPFCSSSFNQPLPSFCPDGAVLRGPLAYYLVTGIMEASNPALLPDGGSLASAYTALSSADCGHDTTNGDYGFTNHIEVLSPPSTIYTSETLVPSPSDRSAWTYYVDQTIYVDQTMYRGTFQSNSDTGSTVFIPMASDEETEKDMARVQ
jgi:hypothetical protein